MKLLEDRIVNEGLVKDGNVLKVDAFLNHQMDTVLLNEMAKEWKRLFEGEKIDKILTIESSGIGPATIAGQHFNVPVVFARKEQNVNLDGELYITRVESFAHGKVYDVIVSKKFISKGDRILIIDDFLANANGLLGLIRIIEQAEAEVAGIGIGIEKRFQGGGDILRNKGYKVESLALIEKISGNQIEFGSLH